jgi:SEC-C motif
VSDSTNPHDDHDHSSHDDDAVGAIVAKLVTLLDDGAAHTFETLFDGLVDLLPDDTDEAEGLLDNILMGNGRFITLDDERWIDLPTMLSGRCFTHRVSDAEVAAGIVLLRPDIDVTTLPFVDTIPLADGTDAEIVFEDDLDHVPAELFEPLQGGALSGPDGWLGDVAADATVGVTCLDGTLQCGLVTPDASLTEAASARLAEVFAGIIENDDDPVDSIELVLTWFLADPDALRTPHEPLTTLLETAGLETRGDFVGRTGSGWLTPHQHMRLQERVLHKEVYGFDECCHEALDLAYGVFHGTVRDVAPRDVATALSHGSVADAFTMSLMGRAGHHSGDMAKQMVGFADELVAASRGAEAAGPRYVQSVGYECLGQVVEAEEAARAALRAEPAHRAASEVMAGYLDDRGDAARALEHLIRAGVREDDRQVVRLQQIVASASPKVARNDPCPCGSGKKFKSCCIDKPTVAADLQFDWLYAKAMSYAMHPSRSGVAVHLAMHTLEREGVEESPSARAASDPRFAELAVFDEGLLDEFLDAREAILPAAEVDIAEQWLEQPLGVFEVTNGDEPAQVELRDTSANEPIVVRGDHGLSTGEVVVARLLPVGDELWLGGPVISVPDALRASAEALVGAADGHTWAEWIGYAQAPEGDGGPPPTPGGGHHHHHH